MAKETFLQIARADSKGNSLKNLQHQVECYLWCLVEGELGSDEEIYGDLRDLLVSRLLCSEKMVEMAVDDYERKAYKFLKKHYAAIFRNPDAIDQWMYTYSVGQIDYYIALRAEEKVKRWNEITKAMERVIKERVG